MQCWKCGAPLSDKDKKISFRATCETCGSDLHCCQNCQFYAPGRANDCAIPGTDYVADRSRNNFCEEFQLLGKFSVPPVSKKKNFDDLFKG